MWGVWGERLYKCKDEYVLTRPQCCVNGYGQSKLYLPKQVNIGENIKPCNYSTCFFFKNGRFGPDIKHTIL